MNYLYAALYGGTIVLLMVGAQLQVLKGALVCPDWPLCFGEFLPLYMTPAFYESLHRFLAGLVLIGSFVWGLKNSGSKRWLPFFLVILQSLLGLATFMYKLPTVTTILHLVFSLIFLASLEGTHALKFDESLREKWNPKLKDVTGSFLFLLLFQFILGGILRKSSLLASCESTMEFFDCWQRQAEIPLAGNLSLIHRSLGLVTTLSGLFVFGYLAKHLPRWKPAAIVGIMLMVGQIFLGLQMGRSSARGMILAHFALALASFCILLFLQVRLRRHEFHFFGKAVPTYYNDILDLFKPKLTILVVITVLGGVVLTDFSINLILLLISLFGIYFQAAGALALNCYIERDLDRLMERTKNRPLPSGRLKPIVAVYWGWGLISLGTLVLILSSNVLTAFLGLFSAISYLYLYTPMKTRSPYALYVGAVPGAIPTLMGWTVVMDSLTGIGAYLFGILFLWQIPHFMAISLYRKNEYGMAHFKTFAQTHSYAFLRSNIIFYSLLMLGFGLLPYFWEWRGEAYLWTSLAIGVILFSLSLLGLNKNEESSRREWGRIYFFATLFYLPLQLITLIILR